MFNVNLCKAEHDPDTIFSERSTRDVSRSVLLISNSMLPAVFQFLVQATTSPGYSGGEEMEEDDEEEEEEGDESMGEEEKEGEEESEEEGQIDSSNAQNIFEVKAFTDLIFSGK